MPGSGLASGPATARSQLRLSGTINRAYASIMIGSLAYDELPYRAGRGAARGQRRHGAPLGGCRPARRSAYPRRAAGVRRRHARRVRDQPPPGRGARRGDGPIGPQPVHRDRHQSRQGPGRRPGRAAGGSAPGGVADDPRGRRRARPRPRDAGRRRGQGDQRGRRASFPTLDARGAAHASVLDPLGRPPCGGGVARRRLRREQLLLGWQLGLGVVDRDQGVRGRIADRRVQQDRPGLHRGQSERQGHLQLRRQPGAGHPDPAERPRRRVRLGRHHQHGQGQGPGGHTPQLRQQPAPDRRRQRQPQGHQGAVGPVQPRPQGRAGGARRAGRQVRRPGAGRPARHRQAGLAGGQRQGGGDQGLPRRGRRRDRLRDRRHRRRRQGRGRRHPQRPERPGDLPDRDREGQQPPVAGAGVHEHGRLRPGSAGPQELRVPAAAGVVTVTARRRHRRAATDGARAGAPILLVVPALLAVGFLAVPLLGLLEQTSWRNLLHELAQPQVLVALRLSLVCGVPLAFLLARVRFPGRNLVRALTTLPMVLPPVVGGVALLLAFGRRGLAGQWLDRAFGITLPFTTAGAILAEAFVAMPFLIITTEAGLRAMDRRYEDAAATLGAGRWTTFRRVTVPLIAPSLGAGAALCWARALGEFGATITFAGNLPGTTQTMPLAVYLALENDLPAAIALSLVLLAVSLAVLIVLRDRWFPTA